ncbi:MAG TPA: hypothetical protein VFD82_12175 [Planctomycetota bacterium]|nr:hypothetical protein [Planctomycetota bacterium]
MAIVLVLASALTAQQPAATAAERLVTIRGRVVDVEPADPTGR